MVKLGKWGPLNHIEKVYLYASDRKVRDKSGRLQHHFTVFTRKPQDDVNAYIYRVFIGHQDALFKTCHVMSPVYQFKCFVV